MSENPYQLLNEEVSPYKVGNRTQSAAMLAWFLTTIWRLEPEDVDDAICDGSGDKGIDALVVDDDLAEITVLQGKWRETPTKKQGDSDLKLLTGAADYFMSPATVDGLLASKPNLELEHLLVRQKVRDKIASGSHLVRLVFVTNAELDPSASDYISARAGLQPTLDVWDRSRLAEVAARARRAELRPETVRLTAVAPPIKVDLTAQERLGVALVRASELTTNLPGIHDYTLFSRNVRFFAGRTRINGELRDTVRLADEHRLFPAFHNGLTLLTEKLDVNGQILTLDRVGVVNGCQSLVTLHQNRDVLTDDLIVLVKVVEVPRDSDAADKITYRSNNQNAVTMRDQRSSDVVMRDLQKAVRQELGTNFALRIRVGEDIKAKQVLDNTEAAQLIMATYLKEPWAAVRKVRLFDQDFRRIFNRSITPHKLYLLSLIDTVVAGERSRLRPDLKSSFSSVRFTIDYLVAQVLGESRYGAELLETPERWLPQLETEVKQSIRAIAQDVVDSVNFHVREETRDRGSDFDPKVAFKSQAGVERLENDVLRQSRRQATRDETYLFDIEPPPITQEEE